MDDLSVTVFYKARFNVETEDVNLDLLGYIISKIRTWLYKKYEGKLSWDWGQFQRFGHFSNDDGDVFADTTSFLPNREHLPNNRYWAAKISEVQKEMEHAARTWTTEIGFEQSEEKKATLSYVLYYSDQAAFIGELSEQPTPSTPNIIRWLISDNKVTCNVGNATLCKDPIDLCSEQVRGFFDFLKSPLREIPVIFIAPMRVPDSDIYTTTIDPDELCKNVLGNALVYYSNDKTTIEEMQKVMDYQYSCLLGVVRIYYPKLDVTKEYDVKRHRYILREKIKELGSDKVIKIFRRVLSQDIRLTDSKQIFRMVDCNNLYAQSKYVSLKDRAEDAENLTDLADEMLKKSDQHIFDLTTQIYALKTELDELYQRQSNLKDDLRRSEYEKATIIQSQGELYTELQALRKLHNNLDKVMAVYPNNVIIIAKYFSLVYGNKIDFTERGWKSLDDCRTRPALLWDCLFHMSTNLHMLYSEGCRDIPAEYKRITGWDLARGEGSQTRNDKQLMALREDYYNGKKIFIEPHIKNGFDENSPDFIRVYFAYDEESNKIIIGQCGAHMRNYSTMKI